MLMKKALAIMLLLMYFSVSTGFVVNIHYCMDRLNSVQLGTSGDEDACEKCGMSTEANDCCFDDVKVIKLVTTHMASSAISYDLPFDWNEIVFQQFDHEATENILEQERIYLAHAPPLKSPKPYLLNCVFLI
jgi:hypothetical protein